MSAPEHYKRAVQLLAGRPRPGGGTGPEITDAPTPEDIAMAQVHATLALAVAIGAMLTDFSEHLAEHHQDEP